MDTEDLAVGQYISAPVLALPRAPCSLEELGQLTWVPVETELQAARWDTLLDQEHFLGSGPLVGRRLRYLVRSSDWRRQLGVVRAPSAQLPVDDWARHEFAHLRY